MALMFPRLAQNFAKNGYYPTDEVTLERILSALQASESGEIRMIDPCAGEGVALAECMHWLGRDRSEAYAVEYDHERAEHCRGLVNRTLRSDLMDTMISRQSFGLLFLNPPYGDLPSQYSEDLYKGTGRKRLEKLFYQKTFDLLQYGGVMVLIVPDYVLDEEFSTWISNHFSKVQSFYAPERRFKQVVIFGVRTKRNDHVDRNEAKKTKERLIAFSQGGIAPAWGSTLPEEWSLTPYTVPAVHKDLEHFYRVSFEPEQFALEVNRLQGLWPEFKMQFAPGGSIPRQPARQLSPWHLALSLAAGAISGVVKSKTGKTLIVKGNTHKEKMKKVEFTTDDDGNVSEIRTMIDKFVPVIKAWDMTEGSKTYGCVLTITSGNSSEAETPQGDFVDDEDLPVKFSGGQMVMTRVVAAAVHEYGLDIQPFIRRHFTGDWGEIFSSDAAQNNAALKSGEERLFSSYDLPEGHPSGEEKLWIITEWDRSVTTVLFPSDY